MAISPRGAARAYSGGRPSLLPRLACVLLVVVVALKAGPALAGSWNTLSARGGMGAKHKHPHGGGSYAVGLVQVVNPVDP
jgi:hypothetical protein